MSPRGGGEGDPLELLTGYQGSAIVATAVVSGVADALATQGLTAAALAEEVGLHRRATGYLLGALAALGLAERGAGEEWTLTEAGRPLGSAEPDTIAAIVRKEWFFYGAWAELPEAVADGHARIAPWRDRLAAKPGESLDFLRALDDLAERFGGELPELADVASGGMLLDAGGGAGSHSARLVEAVPGLKATVLDLPEVEALVRERHPGLEFVAGDLERPRFGLPERSSWDYVLLANVLHDHTPQRCGEIVAEAAALLRPGGGLLVYEWVLGEDGQSPPPVALFSLMMLVENEGGGTWTEAEIKRWFEEGGLDPAPLRRGSGPIAVMSAGKPAPA